MRCENTDLKSCGDEMTGATHTKTERGYVPLAEIQLGNYIFFFQHKILMLFQLNIIFLIFLYSFCLLFPFSFQVRQEIVTDLFRETGNVIFGTGEM